LEKEKMTPERIDFWRNNTTPTSRLTESEFNELLTIPTHNLQYQDASDNWINNDSPPCRPESLVYRLRPAPVTVTKTEEEMEAKAIVIGGLSELAAAGVTANEEDVTTEEIHRRTELKGIKIEGGEDRVEGGIKNDKLDDKLPMELIPPETLFGYAEVMRMGAKKYAPNNWLLGIRYSRLYAAILRHLLLWFWGEDLDKESGLSHLKHAFWGVGALITFTERKRVELDDRTKAS
jgi:hypothetical protein